MKETRKTLPDYVINILCKNTADIIHCDYYMHSGCSESCAYARDIKHERLGTGAIDKETVMRLDDLDNGGMSL